MLCDTGPLVAMLDANDPYHSPCYAVIHRLPAAPLITTWPCLTEAVYLLHKVSGHEAQDELWAHIESGTFSLSALEPASTTRLRSLMAKYHDSRMDFADASLVIAAEALNDRRIFTFDQHFRAYLIHDQFPFEIVP